jgi:molecular chaperone GrpE
MPNEKMGSRLPADADCTDDIEILEVVGVDENGSPVAPADPDDVEVVFEDGDELGASPERAAAVAVSTETIDLRERLLRLQADFENFKKRIDRERYDHFRYATFALVGRILPVLDNFERAMTAARPGEANDALIEGIALIHRQLLSELEAEGLRGMDSVGELFDPERHEAVATDPDSPLPPHTVTRVFQRGYFLHDRVLRPAMVRVRVDGFGTGSESSDRKES